MLEIKNFSKSYDEGKTFAVKDLSLTINAGQIVAFIGHNGSGKSTTIKSIAGILNFDKGDIIVDGISVKDNAFDVKKKIAYLPENVQLYEFLSGIQYLNFIADVYKIDKDTRQNRIEKYANMFELLPALPQKISTYSHGMRQKLAIISILLHEPKLILLDEPFFGLDPQSTYNFKTLLQDLVNQGIAVFYSTHVLDVAEKLATHIVIINKGHVVKQGKTQEIKGDKSLENMFLELENNDKY